MYRTCHIVFLLSLLLSGCTEGKQSADQKAPDSTVTHQPIHATELQLACNNALTDVIVYDILSPPVASRLYAYANLAFYEALRPSHPSAHSLLKAFKGFDTLSIQELHDIDYPLAAALAFMRVAHTLAFSKDSVTAAEWRLLEHYGMQEQSITSTRNWADSVATVILRRASADNYKKTRGMPRFSVLGEKGKWQQTPPEYADATEPHWRLIRPLLIDSASAFRPPPPPAFNMSKKSLFYREVMEVYTTSKQRSGQEDTIARFWDDNPFVTEHQGHLTYANKKMTPVGHWMGIIGILCRQSNEDEATCALAYALGAAAIFDGFISCWDEKYRSLQVRPVTVIRTYLESEWDPVLQTPSFPEYTSGHSVISAAAAVTTEHIFGKDIPFTDTTEMKYLGLSRRFPSIMAAAEEAGRSRLYGGIHFPSAITQGKKQGAAIGDRYAHLFDSVYH